MKVLFLSAFSIEKTDASGAIEGSKKLYSLLKAVSDSVLWYTIEQDQPSICKRVLRMLRGTTFSVSEKNKTDICGLIENEGYDILFYDYAYGATLIRDLRKKYPQLKIIKFFHDVNAYRLKSIIKTKKLFSIKGENRIKYYFYYKGIKKSESIAVKYSDKVLCLSSRDSDLLMKYYGRGADEVFPVSFPLKSVPELQAGVYPTSKNILFIGLMNYEPNYEACKFFIDKVMPMLPDCTFNIVGSKSMDYKDEFEIAHNIKVWGRVDNLDSYYMDADIVTVPLFSGGGMKVKVCEAMSYGRWIYGTMEAFAGYDADFVRLGGLCNTAEEFITAIREHFDKELPKYNEYSRKLFEEKYTNEAQIEKMRKVLTE